MLAGVAVDAVDVVDDAVVAAVTPRSNPVVKRLVAVIVAVAVARVVRVSRANSVGPELHS